MPDERENWKAQEATEHLMCTLADMSGIERSFTKPKLFSEYDMVHSLHADIPKMIKSITEHTVHCV